MKPSQILVANIGSTSFKFRLIEMPSERQLASGGISLDPTTDATTSDTPTDLDSGAAACFMPAGQTAPFWTMSGGLTVDVSTLPPPIPSAVPTARTTLSPVPDSLTLLTNCTQWPCDSNP